MGVCFIVPPHMLNAMAQSPDARVRAAALGTLEESARLLGQRDVLGRLQGMELNQGGQYRLTYDAGHRTALPGRLAWQEGQALLRQAELDEATEGARLTYELLTQAFRRAGIDGANMRMLSTTRYGQAYNNAFWNGRQMTYGSGDGYVFNRFTLALDVIGHEFAHGVTQFANGLQYYGQPGALNEHFSDVVGSLVNQHARGQAVAQADWLVGAGLFTQRIRARALRDMANPGTAYNDPNVGKDPQPDHMSRYYQGPNDNQGVHINSGIPNRAYVLAARAIGGKAWEGAGLVWFRAHTAGGVPTWCDFRTYAGITARAAGEVFGPSSAQQQAVAAAWDAVGVRV